MTQLIIDGHEAVLPQNFSTTVKRENSFFTKNGEYTYDVTLKLDNPVNCELYAFLNRLNKSEQIDTKRPATLIADGHVYCRGTEIVTQWTEDSVTIQIVSGESELNFFIGQDQKIQSLNMGKVNTVGPLNDLRCCLPTIAVSDGQAFNWSVWDGHTNGFTIPVGMKRYQPRLVPLITMIVKALGYTIGKNQLEDSVFKFMFLVNTSATTEFSKMVPGWSVKDFLTEIEKLCGVVFVTNNKDTEHPTCDILFRHNYYREATQFTLHNVVDGYEMEVDNEGSDELSGRNIAYDLPDNDMSRHQRLPEGFEDTVDTVECGSYEEVKNTLSAGNARTIAVDTTNGRKYVMRHLYKDKTWYPGSTNDHHVEIRKNIIEEVDYLADVVREGHDGEDPVELKIVPAPIDWYMYDRYHWANTDEPVSGDVWDANMNGVMRAIFMPDASIEETEYESEGEETGYDIYEAIGSYENQEASADQLYVALCNGEHPRDGKNIDVAYIDGYLESLMAAEQGEADGVYDGSLILSNLDAEIYSNGYDIDTNHAVTFETYDPNVIDVRQVYVIRNKRYVCRDVEEVITAEGRKAKWKGTFFPIHVSDEALLKKWVLTHGVWDDGAAWLDDGRWNDNYDGAVI